MCGNTIAACDFDRDLIGITAVATEATNANYQCAAFAVRTRRTRATGLPRIRKRATNVNTTVAATATQRLRQNAVGTNCIGIGFVVQPGTINNSLVRNVYLADCVATATAKAANANGGYGAALV